MSGLLQRFVVTGPAHAPAEPDPAPPTGQRGSPPVLGVLAAPPLTASAGAAVALAATRLANTPAGLACLWAPPAGSGQRASPPAHGPALPRSRRLAAALGARGHETAAAGRLALVRLGADDVDAAAEGARVLAAANGAAAVLALGARSAPFDTMLAACDALLLWPDAGALPPLVDLALAGLRALGPPAVAVTGRLGACGRMLALLGLAAPAGATAALHEALA